MTYKCPTCLCVFDEPKRWTDPHGEPQTGCAWCYDGGYAEAEPCRMCGEYTPISELKRTDGLCAECLVDSDKEIEDEQ